MSDLTLGATLGPVINGTQSMLAGQEAGQKSQLIHALSQLDTSDPDAAGQGALAAYTKAGMTDAMKAQQEANFARQNRAIGLQNLADAKARLAAKSNQSSVTPADQPAADPAQAFKLQNGIADDIEAVAKLPPEQRAQAAQAAIAKYSDSHGIDPNVAAQEFSNLDDDHLAYKAAQHRAAAQATLAQPGVGASQGAQGGAQVQPQPQPVSPQDSTYTKVSDAILDPTYQQEMGAAEGLTGMHLGNTEAKAAAEYQLAPRQSARTTAATAAATPFEATIAVGPNAGQTVQYNSREEFEKDNQRFPGIFGKPSQATAARITNENTPAMADVVNPDGSISPKRTTVAAQVAAGQGNGQGTPPTASAPETPSKRGNINTSDMVGADGKIDPKNFFKDFTAVHEGGYNPRDMNGSPTNFGINQAANPNVDVSKITKDQAGDIAATKYFAKYKDLPPAMAAVAMDTAFINPSKADQFLKASGGDPQKFMDQRDAWMAGMVKNNPEAKKYENAWALRNNDLRSVASQLSSGTQPAAPTSPVSGIPSVGPSNVQVAAANAKASPVVASGAAQASTISTDNAAANDLLKHVTSQEYNTTLQNQENAGLQIKNLAKTVDTGPLLEQGQHWSSILAQFGIRVPKSVNPQDVGQLQQLLAGNLASRLSSGSNIRNEREFDTVGSAVGKITDPKEVVQYAGAAAAATAQLNRQYSKFVQGEAQSAQANGKPLTQSQITADWQKTKEGRQGIFGMPAWQDITVNGKPFVQHGKDGSIGLPLTGQVIR